VALSTQQLTSELADVRPQIRYEASKVVGSLENEAHVAAAREASLKASLNAANTSSAGLSDSAIKLRALEREAKANRDLLDTHLARYRDASSRHNMGAVPAQATMVSRAHASALPSFPKRGPLTLLVMVATALLSPAYVLAREFISGSTQAAPRPAQQSHHKPRHRERVRPAAVETPLIHPAPSPKTKPAASAPQPERKKVAGGSAAWVLPARKLPVVIPIEPPVSAPRQAAAEAKETSEAKSEAPSTPSTPPPWKAKPAKRPSWLKLREPRRPATPVEEKPAPAPDPAPRSQNQPNRQSRGATFAAAGLLDRLKQEFPENTSDTASSAQGHRGGDSSTASAAQAPRWRGAKTTASQRQKV